MTEKRKRRSFYDLHHETLREWLDHQQDLGKSLEFILPEVIARYGTGDVLQTFLNQRVTDGSVQPLTERVDVPAPVSTVTTDVIDVTEPIITMDKPKQVEADVIRHEPVKTPPMTEEKIIPTSWQRSPDTAVTGDATSAIGDFLTTVGTPNQSTSEPKPSKNALDLREEMIRNAIQD